MTKYCTNCGCENTDDAFWCINCNTKIVQNCICHQENHLDSLVTNQQSKSSESLSYTPHRRIFQKTTLLICTIAIGCLLACIFLITFNLATGHSQKFEIHCQINEDFWFEGNYLNTSQGWSFVLTKRMEYTLEGRILAMKTYDKNDFPYDPCNIFSPIDLVIGIGDIQTNPEKYQYSITSFSQRTVSWYLAYNDVNDYYYFQSHTGNNHIIPHTQEVLNKLTYNISTADVVILEGSLVDVYGTRGSEYWRWTTDTAIGNYDCEILLVDNIEIVG
jgi:hypothetical protein